MENNISFNEVSLKSRINNRIILHLLYRKVNELDLLERIVDDES
jgi:hypothetical protein